MYTSDDIKRVTNLDLYDFLIKYFPDEVKVCGNWLRLNRDNSVNVRKGSSKFVDYSSKYKNGSVIDVLINFFDYDFKGAMEFLSNPEVREGMSKPNENLPVVSEFSEPKKDASGYKQTFAYLTKTRCIPSSVVTSFVEKGLIYQSISINPNTGSAFRNIIFMNEDKDYYETHGTVSYGASFHGCKKKVKNNYWSFTKGNPDIVFICESAIDAISLFVINCAKKIADNTMYVSIGGVANTDTIDRLLREYPNKCVLAVDNDDNNPRGNAGQKCRDKYSTVPFIKSETKDWNEDLIRLMRK